MATVTTSHTMTAQAVEESTYIIPIAAFFDEDDNAITPATIAWTLMNGKDEIVNSREDVSATAATSIDIVLTGDDLAMPDEGAPWRFVTLEYTYNSSAGTGIPGKQLIGFEILPLAAVT